MVVVLVLVLRVDDGLVGVVTLVVLVPLFQLTVMMVNARWDVSSTQRDSNG